MNKKVISGLILAIAFQLFVLVGMYINAALPLWTGTEIKVETLPVDPRSMFRGNYARLGYSFSQLERRYFPKDKKIRTGEVVYVSLKRGEAGLYQFSSVSLEKPESGVFLRGRIQNRFFRFSARSNYNVKYGIEAYFAPKEKALKLEKKLRDNGVAVLMVSKSGKAVLKDVIPE